MEESGKVTHKGSIETVTGKDGTEYKSLEFVIKVPDDKYPKSLAFKAKGKAIEKAEKIKVGDEVKVMFNVSSREYKGRYYTECSAWGIDVIGGGTKPQPAQQQTREQVDDMPF